PDFGQERLPVSSSTTQFSWTKHFLLLTLIGIPLGVGAYYGFPTLDDSYYSIVLKEHGPTAMVPAHLDRPLFGLFLQWLAAYLGASVLPLVALNLCLWAVLALEAVWLWRLVYPAYGDYSLLVACMVLAPIV